MANIEKRIRERPVQGMEDIEEALNREVMPVASLTRGEVNLLGGNTITTSEDGYEIPKTAGVIVCENTAAIDVYLPNAEDVPDKRITVVRTDEEVTVAGGREGSGGTVDAGPDVTIATAARGSSVEFFSDGSVWHIIGSHNA